VPEISQPSSDVDSRASLLILDAQVSYRSALAGELKQKGYLVEEACSGDEALARLKSKRYDLLVMDVDLAGSDGVPVMHLTRQVQRDLPIVILTAHATVESAMAAVKLSVVDYMLKPCRTEDLLLTLSRALEERSQQMRQRRLLALVGEAMEALRLPEAISEPIAVPAVTPAAPGAEMLQVNVLALDRQKRQVTLNTDPPRTVELTEGELSILVALMEKPNQVLSYNDLAKTALGYDGMDKWTIESVIRSTVFRLRHKIEPGPDAPCLIRTVRGRGYFFSPA
jgi:DNA-binding response OmpR family regulator